MLKGQKGITLVALVVTIIVLIILAGVSIALVLSDNGLVNKAKYGANEYKTKANVEQGELLNAAIYANELIAQ